MKHGVVYAKTEDGVELPVIDVTNPAFAVSATDGELAAMTEQYIRESEERKEIPPEVRVALQQSMLGKALMAASGTFLDGMSTYVLKLGPENLGAKASAIDRRIAASFPAFTARLRLADMARLLADGLAARLAGAPLRNMCLVNIGGGAGADSWNALIQVQREHAELLARRKVGITVMDVDPRGAGFGVRAIEALRGPSAALSGVEISFQYLNYEWSETERLQAALEELGARDAVCGVSSEGGLFEYGSDEEIVANLRAMHGATSDDSVVVGSVTREGEAVRASQGAHRVATRPRTLEAFRRLAGEGGWRVQEIVERPFSFHLRLVKG